VASSLADTIDPATITLNSSMSSTLCELVLPAGLLWRQILSFVTNGLGNAGISAAAVAFRPSVY
jgi:hypothetical protein